MVVNNARECSFAAVRWFRVSKPSSHTTRADRWQCPDGKSEEYRGAVGGGVYREDVDDSTSGVRQQVQMQMPSCLRLTDAAVSKSKIYS
jgi:hypothetical protein